MGEQISSLVEVIIVQLRRAYTVHRIKKAKQFLHLEQAHFLQENLTFFLPAISCFSFTLLNYSINEQVIENTKRQRTPISTSHLSPED